MKSILNPRYDYGRINEIFARLASWGGWLNPVFSIFSLLCGAVLLLWVVTVPLDFFGQTVFSLFLFGFALYLRRFAGSLLSILMIVFSLTVSSRYIYWRATETLNWNSALDLTFGLILLAAELYAWLVLVLGFFQTVWPLRRKPVALPEDVDEWPTLDVFIPTYNEPLKVVRPTVIACMGLDWPKEKIKVHLLDDGRREEFRQFAAEFGVNYVIRSNNQHAKAGNINHALTLTNGEYVAIFDCDHMPTRSFLQLSMGWFLRDGKLAMLQTPHHFLSPDPFERNLETFHSVPNEGELFYGLVQDGNDLWNATFFCGSCAVIRRSALLAVGGVAVDTVTEDAHTALRMHRLGYNTAYLSIKQAAGLATESLSAHVGQRIRWARGMAQIFRIDNPFLGKGLTLAQRLCYSNAMLHFFYGLPRIIFLVAPLSYLFFQAHIIQAQAILIATYALPHLLHSNLANSRLQGEHRHSFWAELYESTLAWYILRPTLVALINPKLGKFNVTAKGGVIPEDYFDWGITRPYLVMLALNLLGLGVGVVRLLWWNTFETGTVILNLVWTIYNLVLLFATLAVAYEKKQVRSSHRVNLNIRAAVKLQNGRTIICRTENYSDGGISLVLPAAVEAQKGDNVWVSLYRGESEHAFPLEVTYCQGTSLRGSFGELSHDQERSLVDLTLSRADAWTGWDEHREADHPLAGVKEIAQCSGRGVVILVKNIAAEFGSGLRKVRPKMTYQRDKRIPWFKRFTRRGTAMLLALMLFHGGDPHASADEIKPLQTALPVPQSIDALTLKQLGVQKPIKLHGVDNTQNFFFSVRGDEVVSEAKLRIDYAYSPALIPELSHLNVLVNDDVVAVIPLPHEGAAGSRKEIQLDPRLFVDYNKVSFQFIGHYTRECEDPVHSSLWANVSNNSQLQLTVNRINLQNDLALLPAPFFDKRDSRHLVLPMAFAAQPSFSTLQAAGTVASWFGMLASYRGSNFPALLDVAPEGNAVVFVTPSEAPSWLPLPRINGATLAMVDNPRNPLGKLLLVMGRDPAEMARAAQALALGGVTLVGQSIQITQFKDVLPRKPYDAPKWLPTDRPVRFAEIAKPEELQVAGLFPDLIRLNFRVSPDIFTWRTRGVPLKIRYRYTPQPADSKSTLNININNEFIRAVALGAKSSTEVSRQIMLPVLQNGLVVSNQTLFIPPYQVGADNQLQFHYYFDYAKQGACRDFVLDNMRGAVDPDSIIDFSHFPHYTALPNLAFFANVGFPFTRLADLGETAFVLPDRPSAAELEVYLTLLGKMSDSTGYPASKMTLAKSAEVDSLRDKDIIVIGTKRDLPVLRNWAQFMPMSFSDGQKKLSVPSPFRSLLARWEGRDLDAAMRKVGDLIVEGAGSIGAIMAFESPIEKKRSVVVIEGDDQNSLLAATSGLYSSEKISRVQGDLVLTRGDRIDGFMVGDSYYVGSLPWLTKISWFLSGQPLIMLILVGVASMLIAMVIYRALKRRSEARLK